MNTVELLRHIHAIDPSADVTYSKWTEQFYVDSNISIGDGVILTGIVEHRDSAVDAIVAFFNRIAEIEDGNYLVSKYKGHRREYRWNGTCFAECTRQIVLDSQSRV